MNEVFILANPSSGMNKAEEAANYIKELYEDREITAEIHVTESESDIYRLAEEASDELFDTLIVIGGDGTVSILLNALKKVDYKPKVGIIPTGTVNNVSKALGINQNNRRAAEQLVDGKDLLADVGEINGEIFVSTMSSGSIPEQSWKVSSDEKEGMGQLAYLLRGVQTVVDQESWTYELEIDGQKDTLNLDLLLVGVSSSIFGMKNFLPDASYTDGYLHMYGLKQTNFGQKLMEVSKLITFQNDGTDKDNLSFLLPFKEAKISLKDKHAHAAIDGEKGPEFPVHVRVIPDFVTLIVPDEEE